MTSPLSTRFSPYLQRFDGMLAAQTNEICRVQGLFRPPTEAPGESHQPCGTGPAPEGNPARQSSIVNRQSPTPLSAIADLLQTITLAFLPAIQPTAESLHLIDRLLKRVLDLEKLLHRQNNAARHTPSEPEPPPPPRPSPFTGEYPLPDDIVDEHGITNREKIALMRKVYFADVDEFIASGQLEKMMPPPYDPCEIKADKEKKRRSNPQT